MGKSSWTLKVPEFPWTLKDPVSSVVTRRIRNLTLPDSQRHAKDHQHKEKSFINRKEQLYKEMLLNTPPAGGVTIDKHRRGTRPIAKSLWDTEMVEGRGNLQKKSQDVNRKQEQADKDRLEEEGMWLNDSICGHLQIHILQIP